MTSAKDVPTGHVEGVFAVKAHMEPIYLDHAATTPLDPHVLEAMMPFLQGKFGNASSAHQLGRAARGAVETSRERIAHHLNAQPQEIIFTSGGTEADNLALAGTCSVGTLITSAVEHEAVLQAAHGLEQRGVQIQWLMPGAMGCITAAQVEAALTCETALVSLIYVNNETGAITRLSTIGDVCRANGVLFHTDAVQAAAYMPLDVEELRVDLMSLSGHKIHGPKGVGVLYVRRGTEFTPQLRGGAQERGRRGGTENVAAIVGMAAALDRARKIGAEAAERISALRQDLTGRLSAALGDEIVINTPEHAAPHILNLAFKPLSGTSLDGEMLLLNLDLEGVLVSAGSACSSGALAPSHVLSALGLDHDTARAALRFSLGRDTSAADIETAAERLIHVVRRMRATRSS